MGKIAWVHDMEKACVEWLLLHATGQSLACRHADAGDEVLV